MVVPSSHTCSVAHPSSVNEMLPNPFAIAVFGMVIMSPPNVDSVVADTVRSICTRVPTSTAGVALPLRTWPLRYVSVGVRRAVAFKSEVTSSNWKYGALNPNLALTGPRANVVG